MGEVFQYLVPVEARRKLLQAMLSGVEGSVQEIANTCHLPYATAHREIEAMSVAGLVLSWREGAQRWFQINDGHPTVRHLRGLLQADLDLLSRQYTKDEETLIRNLVARGAPLAVTGHAPMTGDAADVLARGAKFARRDYMVTRALPVAIIAQVRKAVGPTNIWQEFYAAARENDAVRELGFFLDLCYRITDDKNYLRNATTYFHDDRWSQEFFHHVCWTNETEARAAKHNTPRFAMSGWKYWIDLSVDDAKRFCQKHITMSLRVAA